MLHCQIWFGFVCINPHTPNKQPAAGKKDRAIKHKNLALIELWLITSTSAQSDHWLSGSVAKLQNYLYCVMLNFYFFKLHNKKAHTCRRNGDLRRYRLVTMSSLFALGSGRSTENLSPALRATETQTQINNQTHRQQFASYVAQKHFFTTKQSQWWELPGLVSLTTTGSLDDLFQKLLIDTFKTFPFINPFKTKEVPCY